jgi:hypothetical protein
VVDKFDFLSRELPQVKEVFIEEHSIKMDQGRSLKLSEE